jgi:hypothetical protein
LIGRGIGQRKLYIWVARLAGVVRAWHVLQVHDAVPDMVRLHRGGWFRGPISHRFFVRAILLDAVLLPVSGWFFAAVAHAGQREIDLVSWLLLAMFYPALWWLGYEVDHLSQVNSNQMPVKGRVTNPLGLLLLAVATGVGFWKSKQET